MVRRKAKGIGIGQYMVALTADGGYCTVMTDPHEDLGKTARAAVALTQATYVTHLLFANSTARQRYVGWLQRWHEAEGSDERLALYRAANAKPPVLLATPLDAPPPGVVGISMGTLAFEGSRGKNGYELRTYCSSSEGFGEAGLGVRSLMLLLEAMDDDWHLRINRQTMKLLRSSIEDGVNFSNPAVVRELPGMVLSTALQFAAMPTPDELFDN